MTDLFTPNRPDGLAYWKAIYNAFAERLDNGDLGIGDTVTYQQIEEWAETEHWRSPLSRAKRELQATHKRSLQTVRTVGVRIVAGMDHLDQAHSLQVRAQRSLVSATRTATTVDYQLLSPPERVTADAMARGLTALANVVNIHSLKIAAHEQQLNELRTATLDTIERQRATDNEVAELRAMLAEHKANKG